MTFYIGQTFEKYDNDAFVWAQRNGAKIIFNEEMMVYELADDGSTIEEKEAKKNQILQAEMTNLVQVFLDDEAQKLGYDSCLSVCSYSDTGVAKFDDEGRAFRSWRSAVWAACYKILDEVKAGNRQVPTWAELLAELPNLTIVYSEGV